MYKKRAQPISFDPSREYVFVSAAKEPWGAERSLSIILRDAENELATKSRVLCLSETTASFLRTESDVSTKVVESVAGRLSALRSMHKELRKLSQGTCVVVFSLQFLPLVPILRLLPGARYRLVADIHDAPRAWADRLASAFCVRFAHKTISISDYVSRHLWMGSFATIVPRPIDLPSVAFAQGPKLDDKLIVGIVGRVDREKRIDLVVRAVGLLANKLDVALRVYGAAHLDLNYPRELRDLAAQSGDNIVEFAGVRDTSTIYSEIDVLVVANENEPSGRTVGEAMMHGVVVVAPDLGGAREFFEPGVSGLTYVAGSTESLASVLSDLAQSPAKRKQLAVNAKVQILAERAPQAAVGAYAKVLKSVVTK